MDTATAAIFLSVTALFYTIYVDNQTRTRTKAILRCDIIKRATSGHANLVVLRVKSMDVEVMLMKDDPTNALESFKEGAKMLEGAEKEIQKIRKDVEKKNVNLKSLEEMEFALASGEGAIEALTKIYDGMLKDFQRDKYPR